MAGYSKVRVGHKQFVLARDSHWQEWQVRVSVYDPNTGTIIRQPEQDYHTDSKADAQETLWAMAKEEWTRQAKEKTQ